MIELTYLLLESFTQTPPKPFINSRLQAKTKRRVLKKLVHLSTRSSTTLKQKHTYALLLLVLFLNTCCLFAQEKKAQKQKVRKFSKSSIQSFSRVNEVQDKLTEAEQLFQSEPEKALDLVHDALLIAIKEDYLKEEANAYKLLGRFNFELNEYSLSYKNYKKAIAIYENLKLVSNLNDNAQNQLNAIYYQTGKAAELANNYDQSILYYNRNLENTNEIVKTLIGLGDVWFKKKDLTKAEEYYQRALRIEQKNKNKNGIVLLNLKLGELEKEKKNTPKAIEYFRNSQNTAIQIEDDKAVNSAYSNISEIYQKENNYQGGIEINEEALDFNQKRNNKIDISNNNIDLGNIYLQQDKVDEAIPYLENSVKIANETGDIQNKSRAFKALSEAYDKTGKETEAIVKYKEYLALEDSIYELKREQLLIQNKKGEMLDNAQNKLSLLEKDKELSEKTIALLQQEKIIQNEYINRQRIITYSLIFGILILLITAYLVYRSNTAKNKANQLLVLKSLRAQMNPHFIFNALNSVNSFISKSDERAANRYLSDFSRLMRDVMENSQEDFISLTKEIDILSVYLKLEHHRFKDKFDYSFEVDKGINTEDYLIPPMLIQPYIENAVWHGLRYKKEKGFLSVSIQQQENILVITIKDDGIGRKKSQEIKTENQKTLKSTGIKNIDSRLKIIEELYQTKLNVSIKDLDTTNNNGTLVTITIHQDNPAIKDL